MIWRTNMFQIKPCLAKNKIKMMIILKTFDLIVTLCTSIFQRLVLDIFYYAFVYRRYTLQN